LAPAQPSSQDQQVAQQARATKILAQSQASQEGRDSNEKNEGLNLNKQTITQQIQSFIRADKNDQITSNRIDVFS
jgi:hypothetical protein